MARKPVFLSPHNFKQKNPIAVKFTSLIVAVLNKFYVEYTSRISSLSAIQFTVKKVLFRVFCNDRQKLIL